MEVNSINGQPISGGGIVLIASNGQNGPEVTLPAGYVGANTSIKVVFPSGYSNLNNTAMTLNGTVVVSNQNGTLAPLPRHQITSGTYSVLQSNTTLDLYYTADYDGQGTPAWVVIGNPVVLSSSSYTIYADGQILKPVIDSLTSGNLQPVTSNAANNGIAAEANARSAADTSLQTQVNALAADWDFLGAAFSGSTLGPFDTKYKEYVMMVYPNDNKEMSTQFYMIRPVIDHMPSGGNAFFMGNTFGAYFAQIHYWINTDRQLYCRLEYVSNNGTSIPGTFFVYGRR